MTEDKFLLLKRHVCSEGLNDTLVREIADECELVRLEPGDYLHRAKDKFNSVFLLIHGRINQSILDFRGNVVTAATPNPGRSVRSPGMRLGRTSPARSGCR